MNENFIGNRIYELRTKLEISARDMILNLGQGINYINTIENHKSLPSTTPFIYICDYFGISPKELFDAGNINSKLINDINLKLKKLNNKQLTKLFELLESFTDK